jgi:hypothetical protein
MLGDLSALPPDEVVGKLVEDVEQAIVHRSRELLASLKPAEVEESVPPAPAVQAEQSPGPDVTHPVPRVEQPPPVETVRPRAPEAVLPPAPVVLPPPPAEVASPPASEAVSPPAAEPAAPPVVVEVSRPPVAEVQPPPESAGGDQPVSSQPFWGELERTIRGEAAGKLDSTDDESPVEEEEFQGSLAEANSGELRTATGFSDDDIIYVHGVARIPEREQPAEEPFMLEEKGIDGRSFAFAFDYEGMRFYLSKILPSIMSVSKTGMLLLGKQESLQARSAHESALNELRLHGILLPFAFGSLARGKDELMGKVDAVRDRLVEALEAVESTRWWVVKLFVLDARLAQIVGKGETTPVRRGRSVERMSYTKMPTPKKYDIKVLERILGKEKRIAESVHEELKNMAERSDIETIVGLGSGSSEDWKLILEASYEVKPGNQTKFFQAITDLQYRHLVIDLMLSVVGDAEPFSLTPA